MDPLDIASWRAVARLDPYCSTRPRFVAIGDADALLSSVDHQCRTGKRTHLARMAASTSAPLYVSAHVYEELYRGCHRFARFGKVTAHEMKRLLDSEYLPYLRWVEVARDASADPRIDEITDPNDVLTGVLASLVAPCAVFAEDRSLRRPGFAPAEWRPAAWAGRRIVEADQQQESAALVVGLPVYGVIGGSVWTGKRIDLPPWLTLLLLGGLVYVVLRSPQRRHAIAAALKPVGEAWLDGVCDAEVQLAEAAIDLQPVLFQPTTPPSPRQAVATVLARARYPLLAREIQERMRGTFGDDAVPTLAEVRRILAEAPECTQPERYRWQLGFYAAPLPDAEFDALAEA